MTVWQRMRSERFQLHGRTTVRWLYLTSCQRLFGGHLGSSRTRTCATWPVLLMACQHWVQWWSHNMSWIQGIFTHLHSLHDLYAATQCYDVLNEEYLIISWYLHVRNGVAVARNPPTCPAEKRSFSENLVNDGRMWCSVQVRLRKDVREDSISLCEIPPGIGWRADYMQPLLLRSVHEDTS